MEPPRIKACRGDSREDISRGCETIPTEYLLKRSEDAAVVRIHNLSGVDGRRQPIHPLTNIPSIPVSTVVYVHVYSDHSFILPPFHSFPLRSFSLRWNSLFVVRLVGQIMSDVAGPSSRSRLRQFEFLITPCFHREAEMGFPASDASADPALSIGRQGQDLKPSDLN